MAAAGICGIFPGHIPTLEKDGKMDEEVPEPEQKILNGLPADVLK
jgi:hypothetical protein